MSKEPNILVLIESSRESGRQIISGIADYARHFGPWRFHWELSGVASIQSSRDFLQSFDGVLCRDVAQIEPLLDAGVPVVTFSYSRQHQRAGEGWVSVDDCALGQVAADHFLERGLHHFAFCGLAGAIPGPKDAETGFCQAVKNGGYDSVDVFNLQRSGEGVGWAGSMASGLASPGGRYGGE